MPGAGIGDARPIGQVKDLDENDMAHMRIKICGLKEPTALEAALTAGADYVGFVFFPPSPRAVTPLAAAPLAAAAAGRARRVGLFVDATDDAIAEVLKQVALDDLQLHGDETPERTAAVRARFGLPVIKARPIGSADDLAAANAWRDAADILLFDAKPPKRPDALPGGNAMSFDWDLLAAAPPAGDWMLSGGLTPENVAEASARAAPPALDVSSGVERARGEKDPARIRAFIQAARNAAKAA